MYRRLAAPSLILMILAAVVGTTGCGAGKTVEPPPPPGVSAPGLGIAVASVPASLRVESTSPDRIRLVPADPGLGGTIEITGAAPGAGLNLQEAVKEHREEIEGRPGGRYLGAQELSGPTGTAYWSRGRYEDGGKAMEETRIVTLSPSQERIIVFTYLYPAGEDSKQRVSALLDVVQELEAFIPARGVERAGG